MDKKRLIVVEFKDEVELFLERRPDLMKGESIILSLLPEASAALKAQNIPYHTSLGYFSKDAHERCLLAVDEMMKKVSATIAIRDDNGIEEAYDNAFAFLLRLYLSYIICTIEILERFIRDHDIQVIHACRYSNNEHATINLNARERILGDILENFKGSCELKIVERELEADHRRTWEGGLKTLVTFFLSIKESFQLGSTKGPSVLFYSMQYNFDSIARNLKGFTYFNLMPRRQEYLKHREQRPGFDVRHLHLNTVRSCDPVFKKTFQESLEKLTDLSTTGKLFEFKGYDFSPIVLRKISVGFLKLFSTINKRTASLKRVIGKLRPTVIISAMSRELSFALGELAKKEVIPSLLISHGSHVPPKNDFDFREWLDHGKGLIDTPYQYHLLQSPWARAYVQRMSSQASYHNIFPVIFETIDRSQKDVKQLKMFPQSRGKKILVHASSPRGRGAVRFYVYETLDEYIESVRELIEATRGNPDTFLVIRFRPSADMSKADLQALLPHADHYVIATEGKFKDYLEIADLLISFSSTTIEEALLNKIPVLEYDRSGRYKHLEGATWRADRFDTTDSVYWIGDQKQLKSAIDWILRNHFHKPSETMFNRHVFAPNEARHVEDLITAVAKG